MHNTDDFVRKHQLLNEGDTIIVAVSGGPDSLALLYYLYEHKQEFSLEIIAATIDHGLRGEESREDTAYVRTVCETLSLPLKEIFVDVARYKQKEGKGTQEAARKLRYEALETLMRTHQADSLALGHHGDDQVETLFMQLARGVSPSSVTGMPVSRKFASGRIIRPFLTVTKEELERFCDRRMITPRYDPSNNETQYTRNAFRHQLLPFLKQQNPKLHEHIQGYSERRYEEEEFLSEKAWEMMKEVVFSKGEVTLSIKSWKRYPIALQRRAFHLILNYLYNEQVEDITYIHEDLFLQLMDGDRVNSTLDFPDGLNVVRAYDQVSFTFSESHDSPFYYEELYPGGCVSLAGGAMIYAQSTKDVTGTSLYEFICDTTHVKFPLIVRNRRDGDRMKPKGMKGTKKIKDIFIDRKIPLAERNTWPIVTDGDGVVLWVPGIKKAAVECESTSLVRVTYNRSGRRNEDA
ncbi:tRNA lysidine(34) synthetase TilS [Salimicrobium flavidum]|uniref:tRNA(Ile)-lysidine synthase n=1 Tax=Salimicrobium flavidum TaxID=570947 RepID=A0A1N7KKH8_9BACI|nr:tRNA lysidine(34) synthetase TilS [Salimicrobium flavidum]SIS62088.1 tRNA(Ile)-lysidine synthase [Salimicrobium flavidum]